MFSGWEEYGLISIELDALIRKLPNSDFGEIIGYALSSPGKRVRPLTLIFSCQAFGGTASRAMNAALAIELVHAASLVHDDILDRGIERRGSPSTLEVYGPEAALLTGDFLISKSIELISYYSQPVVRAFAAACQSMSEGEMLDLSRHCTAEEYYYCISKKTASLFSASAKIGCLIAGASEEELVRFERYGMQLGLAYQILDDLEESLGIEQGKISEKRSFTLPKIYDNLCQEEAAIQMCVRNIDYHSDKAKEALHKASCDSQMKARLMSVVDEMTRRGLERCRLLRSPC